MRMRSQKKQVKKSNALEMMRASVMVMSKGSSHPVTQSSQSRKRKKRVKKKKMKVLMRKVVLRARRGTVE